MKVGSFLTIDIACMDCGCLSVGPRDANAPAKAKLYMSHCGCKLPVTTGAPYYVQRNGQRTDPRP
jgi:hypothetical protein